MTKKIMSKKDREAALQKFGKAVIDYRIDKNLSKSDFAKLAGITRPTLEKIECGTGGNIRTYQKVSEMISINVFPF